MPVLQAGLGQRRHAAAVWRYEQCNLAAFPTDAHRGYRRSRSCRSSSRIGCSASDRLTNVQEILNAIKGTDSKVRHTVAPKAPTPTAGASSTDVYVALQQQVLQRSAAQPSQVQHPNEGRQDRLQAVSLLNKLVEDVLSTYERTGQLPEALRGCSREDLEALQRATTFAQLLSLEDLEQCLELLRYQHLHDICVREIALACHLLCCRCVLPCHCW